MNFYNPADVLNNIFGFTEGGRLWQSRTGVAHDNDLWHWFHHCASYWADIEEIDSVEDYLALAQRIGRSAAAAEEGTYVKTRLNEDILVYWEPEPGVRGLFMAVTPASLTSGLVKTLFSPEEGKDYFDSQSEGLDTLPPLSRRH